MRSVLMTAIALHVSCGTCVSAEHPQAAKIRAAISKFRQPHLDRLFDGLSKAKARYDGVRGRKIPIPQRQRSAELRKLRKEITSIDNQLRAWKSVKQLPQYPGIKLSEFGKTVGVGAWGSLAYPIKVLQIVGPNEMLVNTIHYKSKTTFTRVGNQVTVASTFVPTAGDAVFRFKGVLTKDFSVGQLKKLPGIYFISGTSNSLNAQQTKSTIPVVERIENISNYIVPFADPRFPAGATPSKEMEGKAARKLRVAKSYLKKGRRKDANKWLQLIVDEFPNTKAAKDASKLLK